jgi:hypothetical protein
VLARPLSLLVRQGSVPEAPQGCERPALAVVALCSRPTLAPSDTGEVLGYSAGDGTGDLQQPDAQLVPLARQLRGTSAAPPSIVQCRGRPQPGKWGRACLVRCPPPQLLPSTLALTGLSATAVASAQQ